MSVMVQNSTRTALFAVKCTDPETRTECDVNVNDQLGLRNTKMIKQYCDISPILRPMIRFIKCWAKPLGLNSPSKHGQPVTFSSYALVLMIIGLLQVRTPVV
jgi:DNA polymerase sigma